MRVGSNNEKNKKISSVIMTILLVGAIFIVGSSQNVNAAVVNKYDTDWFSDRAHGACNNITLGATGDTVSGKYIQSGGIVVMLIGQMVLLKKLRGIIM